MKFYSTKHQSDPVSLRDAIFQGLPPDNGLYMPETIPELSSNFLGGIKERTFVEIAAHIAGLYTQKEVSENDLLSLVEDAFDFDIPVKEIEENIYSLELFHGPTLAFKDFGARFMGRLMGHFLGSTSQAIDILVATSGDTGSAVGHGFLGVPGTVVTLLYPKGKVSLIQEKQLTTIGGNVQALEVDGTFDDCQNLAKQAFLDPELSSRLNLTSANSINIARLIPQSLYYFYAYAQASKPGKPVKFAVPSGNFGNLCGGLLAKKMGLPVEPFVAATNINHIVPDYLTSGLFKPQPSKATISNAMDVGNPSNFARIMDLYRADLPSVLADIEGTWFDDNQTRETMSQVFDAFDYLMCPHTAIAYRALKNRKSDKPATGIFLSTAHPAKFQKVVEETTGASVPLPPALQHAMEAKEDAIPIETKGDQLKEYLLSR